MENAFLLYAAFLFHNFIMQRRWYRLSLALIGAMTLFRILVAMRLPVSDDEAYYWTWAQHLAFGYVDHPPFVAWLIALGTIGGIAHSPLFLRWPSILCEGVAAYAASRATRELGGDERAAFVTAFLFALLPETRLLIGQALPDPPYLLAWSASLWFMLRFERTRWRSDAIVLGIALGAALLSRFFGWALFCGIVFYAITSAKRSLWRDGLWLAIMLSLVIYAPNVAWNATHQWANFAFTVHGRQAVHPLALFRLFARSTLRYAIFATAFWAVAWWAIVRPRFALLAWTALPFTTLLIFLGMLQRVESYWLLGPFVSLCVGLGIAVSRLPTFVRRTCMGAWLVFAAGGALLISLASLPLPIQARIMNGSGHFLVGSIVDRSYAYRSLVRSIEHFTAHTRFRIVAQPYEIASQLRYFGLNAELDDGSPQAQQFAMWSTGNANETCRLLVTFASQSIGSTIGNRSEKSDATLWNRRVTDNVANQAGLIFNVRASGDARVCSGRKQQ